MLGRFGWKAGVPTIAQQTAEAFAGDIGLSTTMIRTRRATAPSKQTDLPRRAERQLAEISGRRARR